MNCKFCDGPSTLFPAVRKKESNSDGVTFELPVCSACTSKVKIVPDLIPDEEYFLPIRHVLQVHGQNVETLDDIELFFVTQESTRAK